MRAFAQHRWLFLAAVLFAATNFFFVWRGQYILNLLPIVLFLVYAAIYHIDKLFMGVVLFTPLSVNIEEFVGYELGLFLPTEPLLFGILLLIIFHVVRENIFERSFLGHPVTIIFALQLIWILITAINSELPWVSFKFLLMKLWFIVPMYFFAYLLFKDDKNIHRFIWLFIGGLTVAVIYTLTVHAYYGFDEESGHWVMWPFFKDHTSYGAILALVFPLLIGWLIAGPANPLLKVTLTGLVILFAFAIVMSYTRAAWLSLVAALCVYLLIRFRIKFKYLLVLAAAGGIYLATSWTAIQHNLERNRAEHATDNLDERVESMANITTDASNLERLNRWSCAIRLWQERPWMGWGPGTYAMVYAPWQLSSELTIISTNSGDRGNAHSEYLGPLAEQGLPGMLLVLALVGWVMFTGITLYLRMPDDHLKLVVLLVLLGLVTYFMHGILNNYLDTDKASVPVFGFIAILVALDLRYPKPDKKKFGLKKENQ
jgi:O-antigen ligase